jgi:hypothetical protein
MDRLDTARLHAHEVERFCLREVSGADEPADVAAARNVLRLAVGLRRLLDTYHCAPVSVGAPPDPPAAHQEA